MSVDSRVDEILDEIENLVVDGSHIPLTNRLVIDEPDLTRLLDHLREELPKELQNAHEILDGKDAILNEARSEAERIISQAREYAEKLTDENKIVQESREKAELIMEQAIAQQKDITEHSFLQARQLRVDASSYANQVFDHMILNVGNALEVLKRAREELQNMPVEPEMPPAEQEPMAPVDLREE